MIRDKRGLFDGTESQDNEKPAGDASWCLAESHTATCPSRANGCTSAQKEETSTSSTWSPTLSQATLLCGTKPSNCESVFHNFHPPHHHHTHTHTHFLSRPFAYLLCATVQSTLYQEALKCRGMLRPVCLQILCPVSWEYWSCDQCEGGMEVVIEPCQDLLLRLLEVLAAWFNRTALIEGAHSITPATYLVSHSPLCKHQQRSSRCSLHHILSTVKSLLYFKHNSDNTQGKRVLSG